MLPDPDDTIVAIASPRGSAARGVVRCAGPRAVQLVGELVIDRAHRHSLEMATTARAIATQLALTDLDRGAMHKLPVTLHVWPTAASYTRQPAVEIHTVAAPVVLERVVAACCRAGARLAERGEFTLRAFLAGRIDLTQAEAVLGIIEARDQAARQVALSQLAGGLAAPLAAARDELLLLLAELEAGLDFADEPIEFIDTTRVMQGLMAARQSIEDIALQLVHRGVAGEVPRVALIGPPNAGKSSLLNALAQRYSRLDLGHVPAIVSPLAGTTRDAVTCRVRVGELECDLVDTAGLGHDGEPSAVDRQAQQSSEALAQAADLVLVCHPADLQEAYESETCSSFSVPMIRVRTKCDLVVGLEDPAELAVSSLTGVGLELLAAAIGDHLARSSGPQAIPATAERCRSAVDGAVGAIDRARELAQSSAGDDLICAELRLALESIGQVAGTVDSDEVLGVIFGRFCIGK